jgi:large subunit ribosomal protein L9
LALLASPGVLKQADKIREAASVERARLNEELADVAKQLDGIQLVYPVKAGETGKLYGSITSNMIVESIKAEKGIDVDRRQVDTQPIKTLGVHEVSIRLTVDLVPLISVVVHREGEPVESAFEIVQEEIVLEEAVGEFADLQAELEAEEAELEAAEAAAAEAAEAAVEEASAEASAGEDQDPAVLDPDTDLPEPTTDES